MDNLEDEICKSTKFNHLVYVLAYFIGSDRHLKVFLDLIIRISRFSVVKLTNILLKIIVQLFFTYILFDNCVQLPVANSFFRIASENFK